MAPALSCGQGLRFFLEGDSATFLIDRNRVSGEMLAGREQRLAASAYAIDPASAQRYAARATGKVQWCSQDSTVISIREDSAIALVPGTATLFARDTAGRGDSITITVVTSGYAVTDVGASLGNDTRPIAMNDSGDVVVAQGASYFLWRAGTVTPVEGCEPQDIDNLRRLACGSAGVWEAGVVSPVGIPGGSSGVVTAVNDSGDVGGTAFMTAVNGSRPFIKGRGVTTIHSVSSFSSGRMNNRGELLVTNAGDIVCHAAVVDRTGTHTGLPCRATAADIAGNGEVVGSMSCLIQGYSRPAKLRSAAGGTGPLPGFRCGLPDKPGEPKGIALGNNDSGVVVGTADLSPVATGGTSAGALWRNGRHVLLDMVLSSTDWHIESALDVDNGGRILAHARNRLTGARGAVVLVP